MIKNYVLKHVLQYIMKTYAKLKIINYNTEYYRVDYVEFNIIQINSKSKSIFSNFIITNWILFFLKI